MMHPAHRQQVIVIQPLIVIRLYRYSVMDGQVLVVVLPVCAVQTPDAYLTEVLIPMPYLLPLFSPPSGTAEPVNIGYLFLYCWSSSTVISAIMYAATVNNGMILTYLYHLLSCIKKAPIN